MNTAARLAPEKQAPYLPAALSHLRATSQGGDMITQSELKKHFHYNPDTGAFTRNKALNFKHKKGAYVGFISKRGCIVIGFKGNQYKAHRLAFIYMEGGIDSGLQVDHINGRPTDNRWDNLRLVTQAENSRNCKLPSNNTSGAIGVWRRSADGKWNAEIKKNRKKIYLGSFVNFEDAVKVRKEAEKKYGFHENHGRG